MRRAVLVVSLVALAACVDGLQGSGSGLATVVDSTGDTVSVTLTGEIAPESVRRLVTEVAVAPGADDTTLFTSVFEFDVDADGRLWIYDQGSRSVFLYSAEGVLLRRIGREGSGPGEFQQNGGMVILADGRFVQWDSRNARISFFDSTGTFVESWTVPGGFSTSNGLVTDRSGALYLRRPVTDPREGEILGRMGLVRLGVGGVFGDSLAPPDLPVQRDVYVARHEGGTSSTSSRYAPNYFWAWSPDGEFVAGHGGRFELVVLRDNQKPIVIHRSLAPVPVDPEERAIEERSITYNMRQTDANWSWNGPALPTEKAPLQGLVVARDGRIWARVAVASDTIPAAELTVPTDSLRPVIRHRMPVVYEVFTPNGAFLGRVAFPPRTTFTDAEGDLVWGLRLDENDLPAVTRFRVEPALPAN